jgi:hypothetical protein
MRVLRALTLLAAALLLCPSVGAWSAEVAQPVDASLSVRTSLLLAGDLAASSTGGVLGLTRVDALDLGGPATVRTCPDRAGEPDPDCVPSPATLASGATLRVLSGGVVLQPLAPVRVDATVHAGAALLGGRDLALNRLPTGPALFATGAARVDAPATAFLLRPLPGATVEIHGREGVTVHEGAAYTLRVTDARALRLEGSGLVLSLREGDGVLLRRGGLADAEARLRLDDLLALQRAVLPPETPPRRAHLADAFGPFQVVPALLDGALAAHANATLDGADQPAFLLLRVDEARLRLEGDRWRGTAEAAYVVQGDVVAAHPGARVDPPVVVPLLLVALALAGRVLSARETPSAARRRVALLLRVLGLLLLALLADLVAAPLLGVHPLLDQASLSERSRVQLALLAAGMALAAYALVGLSVESLARTAFATARRPAALLLPVTLGLVAAATLLFLGHAPLLSLVARVIRL